ncbi:MAG: substrate-binding domain-containing protein [Opitutales bacterium]|jgi:ribose transport system substrate-binding protein|nr:substrate-binding domain-containing protein [Opitutales bacterium]MDP4644642.1 substrate-binding domain-containing protein [Opitutales bacterium]MDP4776701.1 substrate-binding domain-containing protein [Opitutales bacterium]MDP4884633.1 substrate-binding domain-containing protein [Opitutales bacterium]MDP5080564.1 substrate-binding domain-containing protein [Opitutales bacterium]
MIRLIHRLQLFCLLTLATASILHGQNREILAEYRIGIMGRDQEDAIYQAAHLGAQDAARELSHKYSIDVELLVYTPNREQGANQITSMAELFIEEADGFIISPANPKAIGPAIEFAIEQGQEIVFFERNLEGATPLASIIADEKKAGQLAGEAILKELPTKGRVAILTSVTPDAGLKDRLDGLRSTLGYRRIETIVTCEPNYLSAIESIRAAEEADRNDLIKGWVFLDDWPLLGMPALPWKPNSLPVVAIQSSPSAFMYIDQGYVDALVVHPYYKWGYLSVETMVNKLFNKVSPEDPNILTEPRVVDWRNVDSYRESWKTWLK